MNNDGGGGGGVDHDRDDASGTLRLRLLHSRGGAKHGVLPIPADGAGMAAALELGGERLSEAQWRAANLCRIAPQGAGWQVSNDSPTLVCAVNGERVLAQRPSAVSVGDTLELGLLRFGVEGNVEAVFVPVALAETEMRDAESHDALDRQAAAWAGNAQPGEPEFDLRDLAFVPHDTHASALDDMFGVLDIAGAHRRPVGDPLAELLGERSPPPAMSASSYADALQGAAHEFEGDKPGLRAPSDDTADDPDSVALARAARPADAATLLMTELHNEFVRVVHDPAQLSGRADWQGTVAFNGEPSAAITLEDLARATKSAPMLLDIIQAPEGIDQVLNSFDLLIPTTLTAETELEDVLRLFAPKLARGAKPVMPSLTRREHHDMSPDSHMNLGTFRPDDKNPS